MRFRKSRFHLSTFGLLLLLLAACSATTSTVREPQTIATILPRFEHVRESLELNYPRLGLQENPYRAAARGFSTVLLDEDFARDLSDEALSFALAHEIGHLKHYDPAVGYKLLMRLNKHANHESEDLQFMTLLGNFRLHPEFKEFELQIETRADSYAVEYLNSQELDACAAVLELEEALGRSLSPRTELSCDAAVFRAD